MQQARIGHQNGALLFLSSSGHSQPGWFSSPTARGRGWVKLVQGPRTKRAVSSPGSPGRHRGPQRPGLHGGLDWPGHLPPSTTPAHPG